MLIDDCTLIPAMLNSRHTWARQGKLPSSGQYSTRGKSSSASSEQSAGPYTPDIDLSSMERGGANVEEHKADADGSGEIYLAPRLASRYAAFEDHSLIDPKGKPE